MRIPINLSSEPFRKDRPILIASAACAVFLVALLSMLVFLIVNERTRAKDTRVAVNRLERNCGRQSAEQAKLDEVSAAAGQCRSAALSQMLNALIERKSISWTTDFRRSGKRDAERCAVSFGAAAGHQFAQRSDARHGGGRQGARCGVRVPQETGRLAAVRADRGAQQPAADSK